jgi:probable F420-dependent oxidoreductase
MELGVTIFPTDKSIRPDVLAKEVEDRGFESLFFPEHTHIPAGRKTPYPAGEPLPEEYYRTYDPFVALGASAAVTSRIKLGTGICLVAQHHPINLAKEVASVDRLSDGRFIFGIGYGWNEDEMEDHGVDPKKRRAHVRESMMAMKGLWAEEQAGYNGDYVRFEKSFSWPKPVQQPAPPVFIGGAAGPVLFRHVVEYADGWMPIGGRGLKESWPELRKVAEEAGRDPDSIQIMIFGARPDPSLLEYYAGIGVVRTVLWLPPEPADKVLPVLDGYVPLMGSLRP